MGVQHAGGIMPGHVHGGMDGEARRIHPRAIGIVDHRAGVVLADAVPASAGAVLADPLAVAVVLAAGHERCPNGSVAEHHGSHGTPSAAPHESASPVQAGAGR